MAEAVAQGASPVWVDGGRGPDCHRLVTACERAGLRATEGLSRLRLARGFTAHQLQALLEAHLPREVSPGTGLVVAANLPDLYAGEDVTPAEGRILLARALSALQALARRHGASVVATASGSDWVALRPVLSGLFHDFPDGCVHLAVGEDGFAARFPRSGEVRVRERAGRRQRNLLLYGLEVRYGAH
ncbi:MAG TPA: hypothetical protein VNZ52_13975 [Candidatus Thermoplasmatota archaeon]|nr:hypothetical protein [Candidatus Thermoplasmatota archaeon]